MKIEKFQNYKFILSERGGRIDLFNGNLKVFATSRKEVSAQIVEEGFSLLL